MPISFQENINDDTAIALWRITENPEELEQQLQLKEHEMILLRSLSGEKRNLHWLATRVLLRKMLNTDDYIDCQADENGKPILINHPHHISLSHSYDYAAVMVSKTKKVGIDIEIIKTKIDRVKHKFLAANELAFINSENAVEHLYACWCAKEALYKLNGKKETSFRDHIHLSSFSYHETGEIEARIEKSTHQNTFTVKYQKFENYLLGYVCE